MPTNTSAGLARTSSLVSAATSASDGGLATMGLDCPATTIDGQRSRSTATASTLACGSPPKK